VPLVFTLITQTQEVLVRSLIMGGVIFLLYLPIAVLLGSILHSYLGVAWTLTYKRFEQLIAVSGQEGAPENLIMVGGDTA
jgi:hypothetical protein